MFSWLTSDAVVLWLLHRSEDVRLRVAEEIYFDDVDDDGVVVVADDDVDIVIDDADADADVDGDDDDHHDVDHSGLMFDDDKN